MIILFENYKKLKDNVNFKPAVYFDNIYGTKLSQQYTFPDNLTSDEIWNINTNCTYNNRCKKLKEIIQKLDSSHFPDIEKYSNNSSVK